jgi:hypothetical protein
MALLKIALFINSKNEQYTEKGLQKMLNEISKDKNEEL